MSVQAYPIQIHIFSEQVGQGLTQYQFWGVTSYM